MQFRYPLDLSPSESQVIARVIDVPEAITFGEDAEHAIHEAEDALVVALGGYIADRERVPTPSEPGPEQPAVTLSPLVTAKCALHNAMLERDMTKVALARKLGVTETIVRRLLDLDHRSHIGQVELALEQLGYRLVTSVAKVA